MPDLPRQGINPVWIASYPRSGNTFLRIILQNVFGLPSYSLYRIEGEQHGDPSAESLEQAPYLPAQWRKMVGDDAGAALTLIKTHDLPEDDRRAIYVIRDGRPTIHSYYHYYQKYAFEKVSLTEMIAGACQFGSWSDHYRGWQPRTRPNTLFLRYEDLVARPDEVIPKLADFLQRSPGGGTVPTFEELKQKQPIFFRRGPNTDYLTEWSPGQLALFNEVHGAVMEELGYTLTPATESAGALIKELAKSAAHWHQDRLEHLTRLGNSATVNNQLCAQLTEASQFSVKLGAEINELSGRLQRKSEEAAARKRQMEDFLKRSWIKMGLALRVTKPPPDVSDG